MGILPDIGWPRLYDATRAPRSRSEFVTTNTLENAIAPAANMGSGPPK
ncbi:MAG: hypothetical protein OXG60_20420 [Chloroflexi bacterium]|nr:hypothetical protein [Chloroflexota bacterium]